MEEFELPEIKDDEILVKVGSKWKDSFKVGNKFSMQPALNYKGSMDSPGYSYRYCGGAATYIIVPQEVMELGCLLNYEGSAYYDASLVEPMSCIIGGFHASFHASKNWKSSPCLK